MKPARLKRLKNLLWLYFWLLIFEGALRRWVLPGLSNPLLLVRDPIALLAVIWAWPLLRQRRWSQWLLPLYLIAPLAFLLAISVGHGDIFTALYGCRILVMHLPLIFVFAAAFNREDVIRFAWVMLWLSIPMAMLIATQSRLPDTHFLNVGAGGVGTATFTGVGDRFRPPGTFSFINGVSQFFTLGTASLFVVLYGAPIRQRGRLFCALAGIALVVAIPVSISRSLLAGNLQVTAALIIALLLSRARVLPVISGLLALVFASWIATTLPAFQQTAEAFTARWEMAAANEAENTDSNLNSAWGVFESRILSGFTRPLASLESIPALGYGIGVGTNVGAQRVSGELTFVVGEGAWEATLGELGVPLGLAFLLWRFLLAVWVLRLALRASAKGNRLPLILLGASFLNVLGGQFGQPTGLGFVVVSAGLTLAACNDGAPAMVRIQPQPSALPT
ncbi:MAG: hypothetical protein ACKO28_01875 [Cyanobium sp.]